MLTTVRVTRIVALASTGLIVGLAACGGNSTGPRLSGNPVRFLDSVATSYLAKGTSADSERANIVRNFLEYPAAYGATQATFTVTTPNGPQTWYGFTVAVYEGPGDSGYYTYAYDGPAITHIIAVGTQSNALPQASGALINLASDSEYADSITNYAASTTSVGLSCALESGLAADSSFAADGDGEPCLSENFLVSASMVFPSSVDAGAIQSWSISNVSFSGVWFLEDTDVDSRLAGGPPRKLAAILQTRGAAGLSRVGLGKLH